MPGITTKKKTTRTRKPKEEPKPFSAKVVRPGDIIAFVDYLKVKSEPMQRGFGRDRSIQVENLDDKPDFYVEGDKLIENCQTADYYDTVEKDTKTNVAQRLTHAFNTVFTVCFEKAGDGSERVLRGRLVEPEPLLGRSHVEDLDIAKGEHRLRLVDHRTIKWLIVGGTKYVVK